jgi:CDGSH-type Zn-finger protein
MPEPGPRKVVLAPGRYAICACGRSNDAPLCDGSHAGTEHAPQILDLDEEYKYAWCTCRESARLPMCDGTHTKHRPKREA